MPEIDPAKVCFVIEKSRNISAGTQALRRTTRTPRTGMLTDSAPRSLRRELIEFIKDFDLRSAIQRPKLDAGVRPARALCEPRAPSPQKPARTMTQVESSGAPGTVLFASRKPSEV